MKENTLMLEELKEVDIVWLMKGKWYETVMKIFTKKTYIYKAIFWEPTHKE